MSFHFTDLGRAVNQPVIMGDVKQFFYAWLGKKKLTPSYDVRNSGPKHRQRFLCEVCNHVTQKYVTASHF